MITLANIGVQGLATDGTPTRGESYHDQDGYSLLGHTGCNKSLGLNCELYELLYGAI